MTDRELLDKTVQFLRVATRNGLQLPLTVSREFAERIVRGAAEQNDHLGCDARPMENWDTYPEKLLFRGQQMMRIATDLASLENVEYVIG